MRAIFSVILLLILYPLFSQGKIDTIYFSGVNPATAESCARISGLKVGINNDSILIESSCQKILNTRIFSEVRWEIDTLENQKLVLGIHCKKVVSLIPIINIGNVRGNPFFQLGFRDLNFLKRFGVFRLYDIILNNRHSFYNIVDLPYIYRNFGINYQLVFGNSLEPIFFCEKESLNDLFVRNYSVGSFYAFDPFQRLGLSMGYNSQKFIDQNTKTQRFEKGIQVQFDYNIQRINYNLVHQKGWALEASLTNTFGTILPFFQQGIVVWSYYKRLGAKGGLALRSKIGFASNKLGEYGPFIMDSYMNLRGAGFKVDRGTGQIVTNIEYRHTLFEKKKYCFQLVAFKDIGSWRKPSQPTYEMIDPNNWMSFAGSGARLYLNQVYDLILRVDYGISIFDSSQRGFVMGIGQYF